MMEKLPVVYVVWEDATELDTEAWVYIEDPIYTPKITHQVGYVISDTEEGLILTSAYNDGQYGRRNQIPRGMIREIRLLKD